MKKIDGIYKKTIKILAEPKIQQGIKWGTVIMLVVNVLVWSLGSYFVFKPGETQATVTPNTHPSAYTLTTTFNSNFNDASYPATNAYSSNDQYASTGFSDKRNDEEATNFRGFDFSAIPDGVTINSVNVYIERKASIANGVAEWRSTVWPDVTVTAALEPGYIGSIGDTQYVTSTNPTTDAYWNYSLSTLPTAAQLKGTNFGIRVQIASGNNGTDLEYFIDDIYMVVDYASATIDISGTCDQYDQSTDCVDDGANEIAVAVNGVLQGQTDTTVDGAWAISGVAEPTDGDIVTVFINGEVTATERATAVTKWNTGDGNITGVTLYQRHLTIGATTDKTITNTDLQDYDYSASTNDEDVIYDVTDATNDLVLDNLSGFTDETLVVLSGDTYQPDSGSSGNVDTHDIEINGTLTADGNTLNVGGDWTNSGTFTANISTVDFNGSSAQAIMGATTWDNLTISNSSGGVSTPNNHTANGVLTLTSDLTMTDPAVLTMGSSATTVGAGDVIGIVKRTTIVADTVYTFGNQYTSFSFSNVGSMPTDFTVKMTKGSAPSWKSDAILRNYDIIRTDGVSTRVTIRLHYADSELNGNTPESNLVVWHWYSPDIVEQHGASSYDETNNYVELATLGIDHFSTAFDNGQYSLADNAIDGCQWNGPTSIDWGEMDNWSCGRVPLTTDEVYIPDAATTGYDPTMITGALAQSVQINTDGVLNGGSGDLTISGGAGAWDNHATFNPGTSTVTFSGAGATVTGTTNFNNLAISGGADLTHQADSIIRIAGTMTNSGTWNVDGNINTTEYSGTDQTVLNPNGGVPGYHYLILSGSGTKTMPGTALSIHGDFTTSGTISVTVAQILTIGEDVTLGAGTSFTPGSYTHNVAGNWTNGGATFTSTGSTINFNGAGGSTQIITGNTSFNNFTATTSLARTINFASNSTTTVTGTWTVTGISGQHISLGRDGGSGLDEWYIDPTNWSVDYVTPSNSENLAASIIDPTNYTDGGNNTNWFSANQNPDTPTNLGPDSTPDYIDNGWMNDNTPTFNFDITDPDTDDQVKYRIQIDDSADFLSLVVDYQPSSFGAEGNYNYTVGQAGSYAVGSESMTLADSPTYYWRVMAIDDDTATSAYEEAGVDGTTDFQLDATAPTGGTIMDGPDGTDDDYNDGSLSALSAYWTSTTPDFNVSGSPATDIYQYAIGTTQGGNDVKDWTYTGSSGQDTYIDSTGLTLQTSQMYYFSVRAYDNAGNYATINSDGQRVLPQISFVINTNSITFDNLNSTNDWTNTKTGSFTTTTNAYSGYVVRIYTTDSFRSITYPAVTIGDYTGDWDTPVLWDDTCNTGGSSYCGFGYASNDDLVQNSNRFNVSGGVPANFAKFLQASPGDIVADHDGPITDSGISNETFTITYKVSVDDTQTASEYQTYATYVIVPKF